MRLAWQDMIHSRTQGLVSNYKGALINKGRGEKDFGPGGWMWAYAFESFKLIPRRKSSVCAKRSERRTSFSVPLPCLSSWPWLRAAAGDGQCLRGHDLLPRLWGRRCTVGAEERGYVMLTVTNDQCQACGRTNTFSHLRWLKQQMMGHASHCAGEEQGCCCAHIFVTLKLCLLTLTTIVYQFMASELQHCITFTWSKQSEKKTHHVNTSSNIHCH